MIKGDYDRLNEIAKNNVCAEHKTPLEVAWSDTEAVHFLRCGVCEATDAVTRNPSLTEMYKQGKLPDGPVADNVKKGIAKREASHSMEPLPRGFNTLPDKDLGTDKELTNEQLEALINYAARYHLDPMRGHVVIMYSEPYITIDGYLWRGNDSGRPYSLNSRPMDEFERMAMQLEKEDHGWKSEVSFLDTNQSFTGIGIVTKQEMEEEAKGKPGVKRYPIVAAKPQVMCQKRAEWQALRRAFPIGSE